MASPTQDKNGDWSCPKGYAFPKCPGCGHTYYESKPRKLEKGQNRIDGGLCQWCFREQHAVHSEDEEMP